MFAKNSSDALEITLRARILSTVGACENFTRIDLGNESPALNMPKRWNYEILAGFTARNFVNVQKLFIMFEYFYSS